MHLLKEHTLHVSHQLLSHCFPFRKGYQKYLVKKCLKRQVLTVVGCIRQDFANIGMQLIYEAVNVAVMTLIMPNISGNAEDISVRKC